MDNLQKYRASFVSALGVDVSELGDQFTFEKVDSWDSVAHLALITELEDAFDVMFDPADIINFGSYAHGIDILKRYDVVF